LTPGRTPRVRGLVLALVAVLILMGYAFWRAGAGSRADGAPNAGDASGDATGAGTPPTAAADPGEHSPVRDATTPSAASAGVSPSGDAGHAGSAGTAGSGVPAAAPKRPGATAGPAQLSEAQLMARLRAIKDSDPAAAVTLAREGNRRFPDGADAPERTSILIHSLVATDKGSEARGEAEQMVNHYPDSPWVREVEHFTGAHRHRSVGVNDAGQVIFR